MNLTGARAQEQDSAGSHFLRCILKLFLVYYPQSFLPWGVSFVLKLEIKLDVAKIEAERRYSPESLYNAIDKVFQKYGFRKECTADGTICYYGTGQKQDYGIFGRIITSLKDKDWFMSYLTKWLWYNSDDGVDENDFTVEDVLLHYTHKESAA